MKRLFSLTVFLLCVTLSLKAQQVQVSVMIQPPYSNRVLDYFERSNHVVVRLTNLSNDVQQIRLIPALEGNNGVSARVREDFVPSAPIVLSPGASLMYTLNQLQAFNGNLKESDVIMQGISRSVFEGAGLLPEGTYSLCVNAVQYNGNMVLSNPPGCAMFMISSYDPPMILMPQAGGEVDLVSPQLLSFQWTPTGISGKTRYTIRIVDMTALNLLNANDAFNNPFVAPIFEQSNLSMSLFVYDMGKPQLFSDRNYAVQVTAYDPEGIMTYKNNGASLAHSFILVQPKSDTESPFGGPPPPVPDTDEDDIEPLMVDGEFGDEDIIPPLDPDDVPGCMEAGACQIQEPSLDGAKQPQVGQVVNIGKFKLTINQIQGGNGNGTVEIPYMQTLVEVGFQGMSVNQLNQVCGASLVWVKGASQNIIPDDFLKNHQGVYNDQQLDWASIQQHIQQQNKKVSLFSLNQAPQTLPFILDLGPGEITILGIVFTPSAAYANIAFAADIPLDGGSQQFSMGLRGVCIRPNGFGIQEADARLTLGSTLEKTFGSNMQFILEGGNNGSYARFNCKGLQEVKLKGSIAFGRDRVLPVDAQGNMVAAPARYSVQFDGTVASLKDWIMEATASHPAFTSTEANGFSIGFSGLVLDFSKTKNPNAMAFPSNHPMANDPVKTNWTGVVVSDPVLNLPNYLKRSNNQSISIAISNIVLDGEGLWAMLDINNVIQKLEDGSLGGWGFSMTQLSLDIRKSMLQGGGLSGQVNLPITDVGLGYDASYQPGNEQDAMKVSFGIVLEDDLDIDMIFAQALLAENSSFGVEIEGNKVKPVATLHGSLTVGWNQGSQKKPDEESNSVSSFSLPTVNFQGFEIFNNDNDIPQLSLQSMQLSNPNAQGSLSGFPIKLKGNPEFINFNPEVGFKLGLEFTLSKDNANGLTGGTAFTIFAKYNQQLKRYVYDRTELDCIYLDIDVAVAELKGGVCIFRNDEVYGDGFSGSISATIKGIGIQAAVALQVGQVNGFDYFYFEALAKSGVGLPITATMALYGLGGGFHYNMSRTDRAVSTIDGYDNVIPPSDFSPGYSPSGLKYTPQKGTIGFSATVVFGLTGGEASASAFNGDLTFWMSFTKSNGLEKMGLNGGGYALQPLGNREAASITGEFAITINFVTSTFDLGIDLDVNVANNMVSGTASVNMHASPDEWFIYIGSWEAANPQNYEPWKDKKRNQVNVDLKIAQFNYNVYFMMGSDMPDLPPLPGKVLSKMQTQGGQMLQDQRPAHPQYNAQAPGFGFGAGFHQQLDFRVLIFYANIEFFAGFDVLLKNYQAVPGCENVGINGWFAKGQAYAFLGIDAGLFLDTWFYEGEWPIVRISCSAAIEAQFTNPNFVKGQVHMQASILSGLITVNKHVKFEAGEQMKCGDDFSPFGDLPIVSEIFPDQGDEVEVYDDIRVAFNYPRDTFEVFNEEEPEEAPRYFYYSIHSISLKRGGATVPLNSQPKYSNDGYSAKFTTEGNDFLPEESTLTLDFVVRGFEAKPGPNPQLAEESYTKVFQTKSRPDHIPANQLLSTNPVVRQRYFLKEDEYKGFAKTIAGKNWCYLFNKSEIGDPGVFDQSKTEYLVQFTEMGSGKITEVPCNCSLGEINFIIPGNQLINNTMYRLRVIARLQYKPAPKAQNQGHKFQHGELKANVWQTGAKEVEIVEGAYKLSRFLLEDNSPKTYDHSLIKANWFFKTSKFNTLSAKLATYTLDGSTYSKIITTKYIPRVKIKNLNKFGQGMHEYEIKTKPDGGGIQIINYELPVALITGDEAFDMYDLYGYTVNYMGDQYPVGPLVWFQTPDMGPASHFNSFYDKMHFRISYFNETTPLPIHFPEGRSYNQVWLSEPFVSKQIGSIWFLNRMSNNRSDMIWSYSSRYLTGIGNITLPANRTIWKPHGALTQQEINEALAATQQQQNININQMQLQIQVPPQQNQGGMQGAVNQNIKNTNIPVYPLVNLSDLLAIYDYAYLMEETWKKTSPINKSMAYMHQQEIQPLLFRNKGNYTLQLGNFWSVKRFNYNWNREKPKIVF